MTSKVENVGQKRTFTHKLMTNCNFQTPSFFLQLNCHRMESTGLWDIKGSEIYMLFQKSIEVKLTLD